MAFIETAQDGRPLYIVRWNYRHKSHDGKPYDQRKFRDEQKAKQWHRQVTPGTRSGRVTIAHICEVWLEEHVSTLALRTQSDYRQAVQLRIRPGLGSRHPDKLTPREASQWVRSMKVSAPLANKTLRIVKAMMRWARAEGLTTCMAFEDTRGIRDKRAREDRRAQARAYTPPEVDRLVAACATLMEATIILVGKDSGLRRSELFALCWDCVDMRKGLIHVRRSLDSDGGFKEPKTYERRTVPLLEDGLQALKKWRKVAPKTDLVFCTREGRPVHAVWESRHAGKYVERKKGRVLTDGIRSRSGMHIELNHLRDTYASTIIAAGAQDAEVTIALGHESVETTRRHYADWMEPSRELLADRANRVLREMREQSRR